LTARAAEREPSWAAWAARLGWPLLLLILLAIGGAAWAPAVLTGSEPADDAILAEPPGEIRIRFNEPASLTQAQVLDPSGQDVLASGEETRSEGEALRLVLSPDLDQVSYHVVSLDGHPVAGSLVFSLRQASGALPSA